MMTYSAKHSRYGSRARTWFTPRCHSVFNAAKPGAGLFVLSRCSAREIPILSDELQLKMQLLVRESLMALMRLNDEIVMTPEMNFSKREKEILRWTAEGKTSAEIAMILSISENTVNFHQKNMQKKINAPNKTQVACYAAATGLI